MHPVYFLGRFHVLVLHLPIALVLIGLYDLVQQHHSILRNYPLSAHMRFIFEAIRPELRQYFFEGDKDGTPFSLYAFAPSGGTGNWKTVAYSEEGDTFLAFTLSARSRAAYESNMPVFVGLVQKYAKDIPW